MHYYGYAGKFECRYVPAKVLGLVLLDCVMIAGAFACTRMESSRAQVAGWAGVLFFGGICLPVIARQGLRTGPVLVMDAQGLDYRRLPIGVVPWSDIAGVRLGKWTGWLTGRLAGQTFLCIELRDESPYLARLDARGLALARSNRTMGFPLLTIGFAGTDRTPEEALEVARLFLAGR
jgi:hypothetical protein